MKSCTTRARSCCPVSAKCVASPPRLPPLAACSRACSTSHCRKLRVTGGLTRHASGQPDGKTTSNRQAMTLSSKWWKRMRLGLTRLRRRFRRARTLASRAPSCAPDNANRQPFRVAQEHRRVPASRFSAVCGGGGCGYQPDQRRHGRCARHPQLAVHSHRHPIPLHLRRIDNLAEVFVTERGDAVR